nr:kinesin-like protein KIF25 [Meriones unguiculatus]
MGWISRNNESTATLSLQQEDSSWTVVCERRIFDAKDISCIVPKVPENCYADCSWNSVMHLDMAMTSYWHKFTKLRQDVEEFRNSSLVLLRSCQEEYQNCLSDIMAVVQRAQLSSEALQACQAEADRLQQCLRELASRYHLEQQRRRALHNSLVELKGSIRVHCRIRPPLSFDRELDRSSPQSCAIPGEVVRAVDDETVLVRWALPGRPPADKMYNFERVYGPAESQAVVFEDVRPLLISLLDGYNVCIMAYGQTGSGKSYTMLGPRSEERSGLPSGADEDSGIIPRAAEELFRLISENPSRSPKVDVSIVEIYNNNIFDLLAKDSSAVMSGVKCQAVTTQEGRSEAAKLTCRAVTSAVEFVGLIHRAVHLRVQHPTLVHKNSSRSHLVVTATLTTASSLDSTALQSSQSSAPVDSADRAGQLLARLQLVDLAGSECAAVSGVTGLALKETSFINRSLAALADVLGALSEHCDHIPYRNSKLTHLLQDSIGGDAKLLMILCVSPGQKHMAETLQGLKFGARARQVERRPSRRRPPSSQMRKPGMGLREEMYVLEINADLRSMGRSGEVCDMGFLSPSWYLQEPGVKVADNRDTEITNQSQGEQWGAAMPSFAQDFGVSHSVDTRISSGQRLGAKASSIGGATGRASRSEDSHQPIALFLVARLLYTLLGSSAEDMVICP